MKIAMWGYKGLQWLRCSWALPLYKEEMVIPNYVLSDGNIIEKMDNN